MVLLSSGSASLLILDLITILLLAFSVLPDTFSGDFAWFVNTAFLAGGPSLVMILTEWMDSIDLSRYTAVAAVVSVDAYGAVVLASVLPLLFTLVLSSFAKLVEARLFFIVSIWRPRSLVLAILFSFVLTLSKLIFDSASNVSS